MKPRSKIVEYVSATVVVVLGVLWPVSIFFGSLRAFLTITALLPPAACAFAGFQFRLWHYFAYTALIAAILGYWLWWGSNYNARSSPDGGFF